MHLNSADNVVLELAVQASSPSHIKPMQNANRADVLPVIVKFRRIVKDQNSRIRGNESLLRGLEVSSKNVPFIHAVVRQKTIGCLVFAQSWQTKGMLSPVPSESCWKSFLNRLLSRTSVNSLPTSSRSIHGLVGRRWRDRPSVSVATPAASS